MLKALATQYSLWHGFTDDVGLDSAPLRIDSGHGAWLVTETGQWLFNGFSGLSVMCGLRNPHIDQAITEQLSRLPSCSLFRLTYSAAEELAARLVEIVPGDMSRVLLLNSGAEAVEGAVKIARQHFALSGRPGKSVVFSFARSYHGSSFGAMALSGLYGPLDRGMYGAELPDVEVVAGPGAGWCVRCGDGACGAECLEPLARRVAELGAGRCAAVIVEPVLAAGGVIAPSTAFFQRLQQICADAGMLLIVDESATGFGRTGAPFGADLVGLRPDIVVLAKALTGGYLPLGAVVATGEVYRPFAGNRAGVLSHGSSSSGNPLAVAAALAVLDLVKEGDYAARAEYLGGLLATGLAELSDHPLVRQVRTVGLLCCVELEIAETDRPSAGPTLDLYGQLIEAGVVTHVKRNRISVFPPLISSPGEIEYVGAAFRAVLADYH